jgi:hypothetical protein
MITSRTRHLERIGACVGLFGAVLLASNTSVSKYGWVAFLVANFAVIGFARGINARWLLAQQLGFAATSCLGIYRTFL